MRSLLAFLCLWAVAVDAQNHPELDWKVVETAHFRVYYHQGLEAAAARAGRIAEEAYGPVTELYGYTPGDKVRIVLKDYDDYANGAAFFYHDTIEIWTSALEHDFELRGTSDWLRNVITHEFVHIVSLGAMRKGTQRTPALYLQYFGYEREQDRPDILIGYPDVIASYPVMSTVVPMWFAEGVAQYQVLGARYDRWDSHRDMILRTAVRSGTLLPFDEMGVFGKAGFGNEFVYDHGYGLVSYIAQRYGDDKLAAISQASSAWGVLQIDGVLEKVLGKSAEALYDEWHADMKKRYAGQVEALGPLVLGEALAGEGFSNRFPVFGPAGQRLAYLSTAGRQYSLHNLVLRDLQSGDEETLAVGATAGVSWAPDGRRLLFVRKDRADKYGSRQADLYEYDLDGPEKGWMAGMAQALPAAVGLTGPESPRIRRLTRGLRALYAAYSPDGEQIAFVHNQGTNNNLGIRAKDGSVRYLTDFADGTQLYTPQWSPDGRYILLSIARGGQRDIARLRVDEGPGQPLVATTPMAGAADPFEVLVATEGTDRDAVWTPDGKGLVFASDFSGIFNIYRLDIESRRLWRLTNVVGGAFNPSVSPQGQVAFASYGKDGFTIRQTQLEGVESGALPERGTPLPVVADVAPVAGQVYGTDFLKTSFMPRLMIDEGRFKGGLYISGSDVLMRQNVFAGGAYAPANGDRDLFAIYEYRGLRPTLFLEWFHQKRHSARRDSSEARDLIVTGTSFRLNQLNAGLRGKIGRKGQWQLSLTYDRYDASVESDAFFPSSQGLGFERRAQKPFGYTYLNGFDIGLSYRYEGIARRTDRDINPRGRRLFLRYDRFFNFFLEGFNQNSTFIDEEYLDLFYNQFTLDWNEYIGLPWGTTLDLRLFGGWIDSEAVDDPELVNDFFDFHLGGIQFMKGYTFYSIEGRKAAMGSAAWRFPLISHAGWRFMHLYLDKVYGALYGDIGKAWDGDFSDPDPIFGRKGPLRDVGGQLRFDLKSYYSMPTRVQLDVAYGIDELGTKSPWKFYTTVLFGYL